MDSLFLLSEAHINSHKNSQICDKSFIITYSFVTFQKPNFIFRSQKINILKVIHYIVQIPFFLLSK